MGQTSDQIERHIQETRNDLGDNINELQAKVKSATDWRAQVEERPGTMLALAFGGGLLLSALLPTIGRSSSGDGYPRETRAWPNPTDVDAPRTAVNRPGATDGVVNKSAETLDALKGAFIGVATSKLSGFLEDLFPGFSDEFNKAKSKASNAASQTKSLPSAQQAYQKAAAAGSD